MHHYFSSFRKIEVIEKDSLIEKGQPFYYKQEDKRSDTLIIGLHGFTATTYVVRPILERSFQEGYDIAAPLLPGHGYKDKIIAKKQLSQCKYQDWLDSACEEIKLAKEIYNRVFIFGQSMGAVIALGLASENIVDACAVSSPAINIRKSLQIFSKLFGVLNINIPTESVDQERASYNFQNLRAAREIIRMSDYVEEKLEKIKCPLFIAQSINDKLLQPSTPEILMNKVNGYSMNKWYNESGHTIPLDKDGLRLAEDVAEFFSNIAK